MNKAMQNRVLGALTELRDAAKAHGEGAFFDYEEPDDEGFTASGRRMVKAIVRADKAITAALSARPQ